MGHACFSTTFPSFACRFSLEKGPKSYIAVAAPVHAIPVVPGITPAVAAPVPVGVNTLPVAAAFAATVAVTPQPAIVAAMDTVPVHAFPPAPMHANPSPVALVGTARSATPTGIASGSTTHTVTHAMADTRATLSNITLPAMPTFTLQTDPVPWLTGLRARLHLHSYEDATCLNVAISLLTPEVQNVWAHAFPAGTHRDDFYDWLQPHVGKHTADDDIIRKLQTLSHCCILR